MTNVSCCPGMPCTIQVQYCVPFLDYNLTLCICLYIVFLCVPAMAIDLFFFFPMCPKQIWHDVSIGLQQLIKPQEFGFTVSILIQTWLILGLNNGRLEYSVTIFFSQWVYYLFK